MPFKYQKFITRKDLKNNPNTLYVFGDNLEGWGLGGQAAEMRGEPNAIGIPTKTSPMEYFNEKHLYRFMPAFYRNLDQKLIQIKEHLEAGGDVVWPEDGIGTGLARLQEMCPTVWTIIETIRSTLEKNYGTETNPQD